MTEAERYAFVKDKLACEHERYAARQGKLLEATREILAQKDLIGMLQIAADAARELTGAKYAATGHGYVNGIFTIGGASRSEGAMPCPPGEAFNVEKGGVYLDLILEKNSIRLTDAEMRAHLVWWGLPEGHIPLRGLLGARLVDVNGQPNGLLMASDKEDEGDFTTEDEIILSQLAAIVSLALRHIEARLEAERKSSELEATISSIADGVITYGPKGEITSMNKAAQELLSASPDDFNKIAIPERIRLMKVKTAEGAKQQPDQSPTVRALKGETVRGEIRIVENPRTGRVIWTDNSAAPVYSSDGRLLGAVATFTDITELKLAEKALRKSEEMYRVLAENSDDLIYIIGRDDLVKYVNKAAARSLGLLPEEIIGKPRSSFFSQEIADGQKCGLDKAFETANIVHSERQANFGNGWMWQDTHLIPLKTDAGEVYAVLGISRDITERKQIEEALRESEEKYRTLFNSIDEGFCIVEVIFDEEEKPIDYRFLEINPSFEKQTGLIDAQGKRMRALAPKHEDYWFEIYGKIALTGEPVRFQNCAEQLHRFYDVYAFRYGRPENRQVAILFNDVIERKRAEESLRQSQSMLARAEKIANVGGWEWDIRSGELIWSEQTYSMFGLEPGRFVPTYESFLAYVHPDYRQLVAQAIEDAISGKKPYNIEYQVVTPSSITRWVHALGEVVFNENGQPISMVGTVLDITERKKAEEALLESEARRRIAEAVEAERRRLFDVLETLPAMIRLLTRDHHVAFANRSFREKFGESNGRHCYEYCFERTAPCEFCEAHNVLKTGQPHHWEITGLDGSAIDVYDIPFIDVDGSPMILEMKLDITERKRVEAELIKAKEAAEAAAKAKAEFLANMSHEIRTPMNAVIGMTGLMLEEPLTPDQKDNLELIRTNGDALLTIINDILDFSKMESDKVVLEEHKFNLRQCVEEAIDLVALKASEKGLNLAYTIDGNVPDMLIGDFGRLRQILGNLLSNAVKFTDEGEVMLLVSSHELDGTDMVHFAVQDTGIGIPQDHMDRLFKPFGQMEPSTTRLYGGTGLGLVISKKLVELMGGRIWAESLEGIGSTFHFTIKASSDQFKPKSGAISPQMIGKRVLIVEDNRTNRRILGKQLYDWGMIPMAAISGQEALKYIRQADDFDIAILDMDMQGMSGLELEEEIRKSNRTLPLVLLTSLGQRVPPNHAYLTKPIKPSRLYEVLMSIISGKQTQKSTREAIINEEARISPLRILLAEDNVSSQKVALQMLKKLGHRADVVANGIEALQALERQHYDVVLMDLKMPEMDGLDATKIIRQKWPNNGPKVIALTAYALQGDREKCLAAGMDDYISKPIQMEELGRILKDIDRL